MRAVVQRVARCCVRVRGETVSSTKEGILVYVAACAGDLGADVEYVCDKCIHLRLFPDGEGRMNRSVLDLGGDIMVVSQFTLCGDTRRGRRPSYSSAMPAESARSLYDTFVERLLATGLKVGQGRFQEIMDVEYTNVGPVTLLVDSRRVF